MKREGGLSMNDCGRWEVDGFELTSGSLVEICIDGTWLLGVIEAVDGKYYWFSRKDSIPVILRTWIKARIQSRY